MRVEMTVRSSEAVNATLGTNNKLAADVEKLRVVAGSTGDYNKLTNKPQINDVELDGNKTFSQLGLGEITAQEIDQIIYGW